MASSAVFSPDLGNFSFIPREIRDRVYAYALDFNNYMKGVPLCHKHKPESPGASLLRVSKAIHAESIVALYQVNEFAIWISYDPLGRENGNHSIMNRPGFVMGFGHNDVGMGKPLIATIFKLPHGMAKYLQRVHLQVGTLEGIMERDISHVHRCISGPERPTYRSLIQVVEDACDLLKRPDKLHLLRVTVRSIERVPGSIEQVIHPIRSLRGIKKTNVVVFSMVEDSFVYWNLKGSYGRYMNRIMALPERADTPKYIGDEKEPNQSEDSIFDMVGARWMGGHAFAYPEDDEEGDDEDWLDEHDEFEDFFDDMFGGGIDDEDELDEDEYDDDEVSLDEEERLADFVDEVYGYDSEVDDEIPELLDVD